MDGVPKRSPTRVELLSMMPGRDRVGVLACAAKNNPLIIHFLPFPIIVGFNPHDSNDAGLILRDLALHCPVQAKDLRSTPLFTYSWPHSRHTDRRLGVPWGHVEFVQKTRGLG